MEFDVIGEITGTQTVATGSGIRELGRLRKRYGRGRWRKRKGFAEIRLRFDVDTSAPQEKLDLLLKLTERYCVVFQTIKNGPKVSVTMHRV